MGLARRLGRRPTTEPRARAARGWFDIARQRATRQAIRTHLALLLLGLVALFTVNPPPDVGLVLFVGAIAAGGPLVSIFIWLAWRNAREGVDVLYWLEDRGVDLWRRIDGGTVPVDRADAMRRLDGRADDEAVATRIELLLSNGEPADVAAALDPWTPSDLVHRAKKARLLRSLRRRVGGVTDFDAASLAESIESESSRALALAALAHDDAQFEWWSGRDPLPRLAEARAAIGPVLGLSEPAESRRRSREAALRRRLVEVAVVPPLATVLAVGASLGGYSLVALSIIVSIAVLSLANQGVSEEQPLSPGRVV